MGCCGGQDAADYEPTFSYDEQARSQIEELRGRLSSIMPPMEADWQREATVNVSMAAPTRPPLGAFERRQSMRLQGTPSIQQRPQGPAGTLQWTDSRKLLEAAIAIEQMEPIPESDSPTAPAQAGGWGWGGAPAGGGADWQAEEGRLQARLWKLKLEHYVMEGDGNCQFRAISFGLYGTQQHHAYVRRKAVQYMQQRRHDFEAFLGEDFGGYVRQMGRLGTWGDELTLRAASEALSVVVNVVTSAAEHWFVRYIPRTDRASHEIFLTYIAPLHYNAIKRQNTGARLRNSFGRQHSQLARAVSTYQRRYGIPETPQHVVEAGMSGA